MITSDIMLQVRSQFGDATGIQIQDTDIYNWINNGMREIAYASDLMQTRAEADVMQGQSDYTFPDDILTMYNVRWMGVVLKALSTQEKDNFLQAADSTISQSQQGIPICYWVWARTITLYPTPSASGQSALVAYYTRVPATVTKPSDMLDIPIEFHNALLAKVLQWAYEKDENWQAAQIKQNQYDISVARMAQDSAFDEHEAYPHITVSVRDSGDSSYTGGAQDGTFYW